MRRTYLIHILRLRKLQDAYRDAWNEWTKSGEANLWDVVVGDGIR
jgi:hypothetical protein